MTGKQRSRSAAHHQLSMVAALLVLLITTLSAVRTSSSEPRTPHKDGENLLSLNNRPFPAPLPRRFRSDFATELPVAKHESSTRLPVRNNVS
ncbi:hypothetical protein ZHAS_00003202 [Anopheles sinensis]|uniref:Uncharacterized protein n=1 Tax=Anopheles sinensis TaxID=74873 RepID=A0A084VDV6_ANOSI|nr:hypothetical protein ZHAS_00003202 [Anopheles sinensis]